MLKNDLSNKSLAHIACTYFKINECIYRLINVLFKIFP